MNLEKLFETQKVLRERINYQGEDRFDKLVLALLVELGECANEWRGFKFWSKNQKPNTSKPVNTFYGAREGLTTNPLLEEYVDVLHFILEVGLEHEFDEELPLAIEEIKLKTIEEQFTHLMRADWEVYESGHGGYYHEGLESFISLGEMLGFTWEQVEQAYYDKNKVNHERQANGY